MHVTKKEGKTVRRIYAPTAIRDEVMRAAHMHKFAGHGGRDQTLARIQEFYWWPKMYDEVNTMIKNCRPCNSFRDTAKTKPVPQKALPPPLEPNERIHVDLFGPLTAHDGGQRHVLVITDALTKLAEVVSLPNKTAEVTAKAIYETWICRYGVPKLIVSDGGKEFCNHICKALWAELHTSHAHTTPMNPQANGSAETFNRTLKRYLQTMVDQNETDNWEHLLPSLRLAYNTAVHKAISMSPFHAVFAYDPNLPQWDGLKDLIADNGDKKDSHASRMAKARRAVAKNNSKTALDRFHQKGFDTGRQEIRQDDWVWLRVPTAPNAPNAKFQPRWAGPYQVSDANKNHDTVTILIPRKNHVAHRTVSLRNIRHFGQNRRPEGSFPNKGDGVPSNTKGGVAGPV